PERDHPPILFRGSGSAVAKRRRTLSGPQHQCAPAASARASPLRTLGAVASERGGDTRGGARLLRRIESVALCFVATSGQGTCVLGRVLRAVPPAADRAQPCRGRDAAPQSFGRRQSHRLSL